MTVVQNRVPVAQGYGRVFLDPALDGARRVGSVAWPDPLNAVADDRSPEDRRWENVQRG